MSYEDLKTILALTEELTGSQFCIFTRQEMLNYCSQFFDKSITHAGDDSAYAYVKDVFVSTCDEKFCSKTELRSAKAIYFYGDWGNAYFLSLEARKDEMFFEQILEDCLNSLDDEFPEIRESITDEEKQALQVIEALKNALAKKMETTICEITCASFTAIPKIVTPKDKNTICSYLYRIDKVCGDNSNSHRLLMPFHCLTFSDALCWTKDFSWETFIKDAIETGFTHIIKNLYDKFYPCLDFCSDSGERGFSIKLVCDD